MLTSLAEQPRQGTVLGGKYRLTRSLGTGSMGSVWAAINETTSREVAVKLILGSSPDLRRRLLREARLCGALRHPNIIDMYDVAETADGEPFLVMELLSGETLAQLLKQKRRLESSQAARIALDAARALEAAHALGIIHRDLKPANIFLHSPPGTADSIVKVLDFGVAKNLVDDDGLRTVIGGLVGSPAYMSPEQARADRTIDHRSDLWSLGVVLFQMLTGTRPFAGEPHEVLQKLDTGAIATVSELVRDADPRLSAVVARCLKRDRDERFSSAAEVVRLLEEVVKADRSAAAPSIGFTARRCWKERSERLWTGGDGDPRYSLSTFTGARSGARAGSLLARWRARSRLREGWLGMGMRGDGPRLPGGASAANR